MEQSKMLEKMRIQEHPPKIRDNPDRGEEQEKLLEESDGSSSTSRQDSSWYDGEAESDFWSISGDFICRHSTDGVASRDWTGVCGHHREVGPRTGVDKFDCVMEHDEGNDEWIKDDHREQSSWQCKE